LSMPKDLKSLREYTEYQLVKRVEQEIEMYCDRAKSWPTVMGVEGFEPIRRVGDMKDVEKEGQRVEMALDLRSHGEADGEVVEWIGVRRERGRGGEREVPVWKIGGVVRRVVVPPDRIASSVASWILSKEELEVDATALGHTEASESKQDETRTRHDPDSPTSAIQVAGPPVLDSMKRHLDSTIALFHRRHRRISSSSATVGSTSTPIAQDPPSKVNEQEKGGIYVFYSPSPTHPSLDEEQKQEVELVRRMKKDLVDLWISCWRIGLWKGEGWEA